MSAAQHIEWLRLIEYSGPFLAVGVLDEVFPQDLESVETTRRQRVIKAYEEWGEAVEVGDPLLKELHHEWINLILNEILEYDTSILKTGKDIPSTLTYRESMSGTEIKPDYAVVSVEKTHLLISCYSPGTNMNNPIPGESWAASPVERMINLCKATGVRVGLVTNGDDWSLISIPADGSTSIGTWRPRFWQQEPLTLRAFISLLGVRRFFGPKDETLETLFAESLEHQGGVTETLGEQVRTAIEVLVQALDRADIDRNRELLKDIPPSQLYEAGLTVMMRLVVLLCAEERRLLLLGESLYDQNYAVSTLRSQLLEDKLKFGDEVLERRHDAWSRLLALFRGVFGGINYEGLRLPPLGGSLFDPDRFPFLEGRPAGTSWRVTPAEPLPIDNRTVLLLLNALQVLEHRAGAQLLSYEALDVEQIGHVYEGLLERTVMRVPELTLGLAGSRKSINPTAGVRELEKLSPDALVEHLQELTGRSEAALRSALSKPVDEDHFHRILIACDNDRKTADRVRPFAHLLRKDSWGDPLIYPTDAFIVGMSAGRRETGSHYTPKALTEPIVQHALEPLVYVGPAEGLAQDKWKLKSPSDLLRLKICDMAMGSAAFLVQTCRWLGDRLVESWNIEEKNGKVISIEGGVLNEAGRSELLPHDKGERILIARRLIASRCLYGVDINPMAVELAKLSLWLITLMKGRPFGFLDHALKCGDSLLGVSSLQQIENFSLRPGEWQITFATADLAKNVEEASAKRRALEDLPSNDYTQIETKNRLHAEAEDATAKVKAIADCLIAFELRGLDSDAYEDQRTAEADKVQLLMMRDADAYLKSPISSEQSALAAHVREQLRGRRLFHWAVEFPEVFARGGFDAFVGNPPFMGNKKITGEFGIDFRDFLVSYLANGQRGLADFCAYFFIRANGLLKPKATFGLVATNTIAQGDTREVGLDQIVAGGTEIFRAIQSQMWPGTASVVISIIWVFKGEWKGARILDGGAVTKISSLLTVSSDGGRQPNELAGSEERAFIGSYVLGSGFTLTPEQARELIRKNPRNRDVIFPYLGGEDINSTPTSSAKRLVINFFNWPLNRDSAPGDYTGSVAADYPDCLSIVEKLVKPERDEKKRDAYRKRWWQFAELQTCAYEATKDLKHLLVKARVSPIHALVLVPNGQVLNEKTVIFQGGFNEFTLLQSSVHEVWAVEYSPTMGISTLSYSPSACVATFPFVQLKNENTELGITYHEHRRQIMQTRHEGLTKTYNRLHDRDEQSADIARLRALHVEMDQAVAAAYGWSDLDLGHSFHATKQGERYTLSEIARRTVLNRLLALNHQRYEEEVKAGLHDKKKSRGKSSPTKADDTQKELF
jgi:hypothetical protein